MCFALYLASDRAIPIIPWDESSRRLHTEQVDADSLEVLHRFKFPNVCYVGSDTHCGCGFRNATYQNGSWPEEEWHPEDDVRDIEARSNHEQLVRFIKDNFPDRDTIELYGAWDGLPTGPILSDQTIPLDRLLEPGFYFRERGHYTILITSACLPKA